MIEISLPIRVLNESNNRDHRMQRAARTKSHRNTVEMAVCAHLPSGFPKGQRLPKLQVLLTRVGKVEMDFDGLIRSMKAVRDGVAIALEVDDADKRVKWEYGERMGDDYAVEIRITEESEWTTKLVTP